MFCRTRAEAAALLQSRSPRAAFAPSFCAECQDCGWCGHPTPWMGAQLSPWTAHIPLLLGPWSVASAPRRCRIPVLLLKCVGSGVCPAREHLGHGLQPLLVLTEHFKAPHQPINRALICRQHFVTASTKGRAGNPLNAAALWGSYRRGTRARAHVGVQQGPGAWGLLLRAEHRQQQCQAPRSPVGSAVPLVNASHGHTQELHHLCLFWRQSTARSPRAVPDRTHFTSVLRVRFGAPQYKKVLRSRGGQGSDRSSGKSPLP